MMLTTTHSKILGEWGKCHKHGNSCRTKLLLPIPMLGEECYSNMQRILLLPSAWPYSNTHAWELYVKNFIHEIQELDEIQQSSFWGDSLKSRKLWSSLKVWVRQQNSQWDNDKVLTWDVSHPGSSSSSAAFREGFEPLLLHLGLAS